MGRVRIYALRALTPLLAAGVVFAAATGGSSFLWCEAMGEALSECCCPHAPSAHATIARTCCESRSVPSLPGVDSTESAPRTFAAPLAAIVSASLLIESFAAADIAAPIRLEARAGPRERLHATHSVYLL